MHTRSCIAATALLLVALGCRDETTEPTEPAGTKVQAGVAAASAALAFRQVSAGGTHTCGVTTDDKAYCWGDNSGGELGNGTRYGPERCEDGTYGCSSRPVAVLGGLHFLSVSASWYFTCGVLRDSRAYCWGTNYSGQLGDGTTTDRYRPVAVQGGHLFRHVSAGGNQTCGLTTEYKIYCWGYNADGQLGNGTQQRRLTPVAVLGTRNYRQVSSGYGHTCALGTDNRAYCWGRNSAGQLGDSSRVARRLVPVRVAGARYFRQLDAGGDHTCAVTPGARAFCWGFGRYGQLGYGGTSTAWWPKATAGGLSFDRVTAGWAHTCGETTGNRAYCWGNNTSGQLGNGNSNGPQLCEQLACSTRPVAVVGGFYFVQVDAGGYHTCARTAANAAYCWGETLDGQLGNGEKLYGGRPRPTPVLGPL